jgi:hypothetical protein
VVARTLRRSSNRDLARFAGWPAIGLGGGSRTLPWGPPDPDLAACALAQLSHLAALGEGDDRRAGLGIQMRRRTLLSELAPASLRSDRIELAVAPQVRDPPPIRRALRLEGGPF